MNVMQKAMKQNIGGSNQQSAAKDGQRWDLSLPEDGNWRKQSAGAVWYHWRDQWAAEDEYQQDKSEEQRVKWYVNDNDYVYNEDDEWYLEDDDSITYFNIEL